MKPRLHPAPMTTEDMEIWVYQVLLKFDPPIERHTVTRVHMAAIIADRRDADLMFEQSWQLPGFACIRVYYEDVVMQHNIAGRLAREEFERIRDPSWPRNGKPLV